MRPRATVFEVRWLALALALAAASCGTATAPPDVTDGGDVHADAGAGPDAGGSQADAGPALDAGAADAGAEDAGAEDAGAQDAGSSSGDAGRPDAGFSCAPFIPLEVGSLPIDGSRTEVSGFTGDRVVIATLDAPLTGLSTNTTNLSIFEYIGPATTRKAWLSESRCDMTATTRPSYGAGNGVNLYFSVGGNDPTAVNLVPGRRYYLMVVNRGFSGGNSCPGGTDCAIGIKVYPPPP